MRRADGTATTEIAVRIVPFRSCPDGAGWASLVCRPAAPVRNALARVLHSVPAPPSIPRTAATAPTGCGPPPRRACRPLSAAHPAVSGKGAVALSKESDHDDDHSRHPVVEAGALGAERPPDRAEAGIEELAVSIAAHGLLQSLSVRPVLDGEGAETGKYEVIGGGRRLAALKLLVKRKQAPKSAPVPCVIVEGEGEELSLAENVVRESLHPADQFEAFKRLVDELGFGAEEIAARFGVTPQVVRQRLRLGAVGPKLMQVYRDGGLTLEQLTAFAVTEDHARQEDAFARPSWNRETRLHPADADRGPCPRPRPPGHVRRCCRLRGCGRDDPARPIHRGRRGAGSRTRDCSTGWCWRRWSGRRREVRAEGWKWIEVYIDYPYANGLSRAYPRPVKLSPDDQARLDALSVEWDELAQQYDGIDDLPEDIAARLDALNAEIERLSAQRHAYDPDVIARGGVHVVLGHDGAARIERGFVRPEDEAQTESEDPTAEDADTGETDGETVADEDEGDHDADKPLSDSLVRNLTAQRTPGLRIALGENPDTALLAVTHALAARTFFRGEDDSSCLDLRPNSAFLGGGMRTASPTPRRRRGWRNGMPPGPRRCRRMWPICGVLSSPSTTTSGWPCSPIARR